MTPITRPFPPSRTGQSMAQREKAHFLALDVENRRVRRKEKMKALRRLLPF